MASSAPCATIAWDPEAPAFHVSENDEDAEKARYHFSNPHLYYVGSHEGCGCGFRREGHEFVDDPEEIEQRRENHLRLRDYISQCLTSQKSVELYACWSGDEDQPCDKSREVSVASLADDSFVFDERELTIVIP